MSVIVKAGSDICKANTNTSTAKFQYSFSKASRFPIPDLAEQIRKKKIQDKIDKGELEPEKPKKPVNYEKEYYKLLPSTLSTRKTTFGKGNKSDFTKGGNNCIKSCYDPYTDFDPKNPHGPKYSFTKANRSGKGPTKTKKQELEEKEKEENNEEQKNNKDGKIVDINGPSPAAYNYLKQFGWDAPKVSMKGRHNTPIKKKGEKEGEESEKKEEPYLTKVTIQIRNNGKYVVSQIPNVNSIKFDKDKSKRTQFVSNKNPGPNKYEIKPLLGRVVQSQYRSYEPITIASRHTVKDSRSNYPGPGSYPLPSDFGIYQSKDANKYPQDNVYVEKKPKFEEKAWRHNMKKIEPKPEPEPEPEPEEPNNETPGADEGNNNEEEEAEKRKQEEEAEKRKQEEEEEKKRQEEEEQKKKEEEKKKKEEEEKKGKEKEEDKESEVMMLKDILVYKEGEDTTPNA